MKSSRWVVRALLAIERDGQALEADIAVQDLFQVAAFLARQQRGGVDFLECPLRGKGVGKQFAALHSFANILQQGLHVRVLLPLDQQIQRVQNRQSGLDQGQELLVEDHELALLDLPSPELKLAAGKQASGFYPIDQVTLLHKALANLGFRVTMFHLLRQMATIVRDFNQKLGHTQLRYPSVLPSLAFGSINLA